MTPGYSAISAMTFFVGVVSNSMTLSAFPSLLLRASERLAMLSLYFPRTVPTCPTMPGESSFLMMRKFPMMLVSTNSSSISTIRADFPMMVPASLNVLFPLLTLTTISSENSVFALMVLWMRLSPISLATAVAFTMLTWPFALAVSRYPVSTLREISAVSLSAISPWYETRSESGLTGPSLAINFPSE